jgi:hypothetical protein
VVLLSACSSSSSGGASQAQQSPSAAVTTPPPATTAACALPAASAAAALPSGFPVPVGSTFYQLSTLGKTKVHFGYVAGTNVVTERDAIKRQLVAAGFHINGQDQEPNAEAELDADSAAHGGTLQVVHFTCAGYLRLRFTLDH